LICCRKEIVMKDILLNLIYPRRCPVCNEALKQSDLYNYICAPCKAKLSYIKGNKCSKCGKPLEQFEEEYCYDCKKIKHIYERGFAVWAYDEEIKKSMYRFKYHNRREFADFYAKELADIYGVFIKHWECDVIIPVPLHKKKYKRRGYNQAALIAKKLSRRLEIAYDDSFLIRAVETKAQKELDDKERYNNLIGAFQIANNGVKYNKVIIVDDIYTTGATIDACARVLKDNGITKVYYLSACIGYGI